MTMEMGKTVASAGAEVDKCAWGLRHYAEHAEAYLAHDVIDTDADSSYVRFDPLGPILAVMPWNFPFWQAIRAAAPALAAGNTMVSNSAGPTRSSCCPTPTSNAPPVSRPSPG